MVLICFHLTLEIANALALSIPKCKAVSSFLIHLLPVAISITFTSPLQLIALVLILLGGRFHLILHISDASAFRISKGKTVSSLLRHLLLVVVGIAFTFPLQLIAFLLVTVFVNFQLTLHISDASTLSIPEGKTVSPLLCHFFLVLLSIAFTVPLQLIALMLAVAFVRLHLALKIADTLTLGIPKRKAISPLNSQLSLVGVGITFTVPLQLKALVIGIVLVSLQLILKITDALAFGISMGQAVSSLLGRLFLIFVSITFTSPLQLKAVMVFLFLF